MTKPASPKPHAFLLASLVLLLALPAAAQNPIYYGADSDVNVTQIRRVDSNANGSLVDTIVGDALALDLKGYATSGELDYMELVLSETLTGQSMIEMEVTLPERVDQSWSLVIEPVGSGSAWTAFYSSSYRILPPNAAWQYVTQGLSARQVILLALLIDGDTGSVAIYVNGQLQGTYRDDISSLNIVRFRNYGYGEEDLSYFIRNIRVKRGWPGYPPKPALAGPLTALATGGDGAGLLTWIPHPYYTSVRVQRSTTSYPAGPNDGVTVYEGTADSLVDPGLGAGTYYYSVFAQKDGLFSAPTRAGAQGAQVTHAGLPAFFAADSQVKVSSLRYNDGDGDGTLMAAESQGALALDFAGEADSEERDYLDIALAANQTGRLAVELDLTLPSRLDQSWYLVIELLGSNGIWSAFEGSNFRICPPDTCWQMIATGLTPSATVPISYLFDTTTGAVTVFVAGQEMGTYLDDLRRLDRIRLHHYGYSAEDQSVIIDNVRVLTSWPDYYAPPPLAPPVNAIATGGRGQALVAWTPMAAYPLVRVMRKTGGYSANENDGTMVYEGTAKETTHVVAPGTHYYTLFARDQDTYSAPLRVGTNGTVVQASGLPTFFSAQSEVSLSRALIRDGDADATIQVEEVAGALEMDLLGSALSEERDYVQYTLEEELKGQVTVEYDVVTPDRMDQSWSLVIEMVGSGSLWTAFEGTRYRISVPTLGWSNIASSLAPNTLVHIAAVMDTATGVVTFYVDGVQTASYRDDLSALSYIRFYNYGYAEEDLSYQVKRVKVIRGWPDYHELPPLTPPVNAAAAGGDGAAHVAWVVDPVYPKVRVVSQVGRYPLGPEDGVVVYEGQGRWASDLSLAPGTYYYSVFREKDGAFSDPLPVGAQGTQVTAQGTPAFFDPASEATINHLELNDTDYDGTIRAMEDNGALRLDLAGDATSGENDNLDFPLDTPMTGIITVEMDITTPSAMDQSWSLVVEMIGLGNVWSAFEGTRFQICPPVTCWQVLDTGLDNNRTYRFTFVLDTDTGTVTAYTDGEYRGAHVDDLFRLDRIRFHNYGYATTDLTWRVDNVLVRQGAPAYHQTPPISAPLLAVATGAKGQALLSWLTSPYYPLVRVVRKQGGYPTGTADGTTVFEGIASRFEDMGLAPGTYYYTVFSNDHGQFSPGTNAGTQGTLVQASGLPAFFGPGSQVSLSRLQIVDGDADATMAGDEQGDTLVMALDGAAASGEVDFLDYQLESNQTGQMAVLMDVTTPARMDQSWSMLIELVGSGGIWSAFEGTRFRVSVPSTGWQTIADGLRANTTYRIAYVFDTATGIITFYVDGERKGIYQDDLWRLDRIRMRNYGYATESLTWRVRGVEILKSWPAWHEMPPLEPPVNATASGAVEQVVLAWTPAPGYSRVRVVRKTGAFPANATDGTVVYEGTATAFDDTGLATGAYYYSLFSVDGNTFSASAPVGSGPVEVQLSGRPVFMHDQSSRTLQAVRILDGDYDATFKAVESQGRLRLTLDGSADSEERDRVEYTLDQPLSGQFTLGMKVTTPARMDQSWSLVVEAIGQGSLWTAFSGQTYSISAPIVGWTPVGTNLAPSTTYTLDLVIDTTSGLVVVYLDGQRTGTVIDDLTRLDRIVLHNYGYAETDLVYGLDDLRVDPGAPAFHVVPPIEPPVQVVASGGQGEALLAWTTDPFYPVVRLLRKGGSYPVNPTDGTVVYEGTATSFNDTPLVPGTYYYTAFSVGQEEFSGGTQAGTAGTVVQASGVPVFVDNATEIRMDRITLIDTDRDATLGAKEIQSALVLDLAGLADSGEQDGVTYRLAEQLTGQVTFELDVTTPDRLDQSWSLIIEPGGSGSIWSAFEGTRFRVSVPGTGWQAIKDGLQPKTTYHLAYVMDLDTGATSFYVDGQPTITVADDMTRLDWIRFRNYGYAFLDLTWKVDNVKISRGLPLYHVVPPFVQPANFVATSGQGEALLAWTVNPAYPTVKVVRNAKNYPAHVDDGVVAYEGRASKANDAGLAPGTYYYAAFCIRGADVSPPTNAGTQGTFINPAGVPAFFSDDSDLGLASIQLWDGDYNASFKMDEGNREVVVDLAGIATSEEQDLIDLELTERLQGRIAVELDVTTPDRMDQSWSLVVELLGSGGLWTAFHSHMYRISPPSSGWMTLASGLEANRTYHLAWVMDTDTKVVTLYIDGQRINTLVDDLARLDRIRLRNYGYATADLRYRVSGVKVLSTWPDYHQPAPLAAVPNATAAGGVNAAHIAWTPNMEHPLSRVVRKAGSFPAGPDDGALIYEGTGRSFTDTGLVPGTYYYSVFAGHDQAFADGVPTSVAGTQVVATGVPSFFHGWSPGKIQGVSLTDADGDATLVALEEGGALRLDLAAVAESDERDYVEYQLQESWRGRFAVDLEVTTPARMDQSWNLAVELVGAGAIWTALEGSRLRACPPANCWTTMASGLLAGATYLVTYEVDANTGMVAAYLDGRPLVTFQDDLSRMDRIRFHNYGYATEDLTYRVDNIKVRPVGDVTPPVVNAGDDMTVEQESLDGTAVNLPDPIVTDDTDPHPTVTSDAPAVFPLGKTVVTVTAVDLSNNTGKDTMVVWVVDTTAPTVTAPADSQVEATGHTGTVVPIPAPTVTDNCDAAPLVTNDAPLKFPLGQTTVTFRAVDASGNAGTDTMIVEVVDTTAPQLEAGPDQASEQESLDGAIVVLPKPWVLDNADPEPVVTSNAPEVFPLGETIVTVTATDASGNESTDTLKVTVTDGLKPLIAITQAPQPVYLNHNVDVAFTVTDRCDANPLVALSPLEGALNRSGNEYSTRYTQAGLYELVIEATDSSGNLSRDTNVTFGIDRTAPVATLDGLPQADVDPLDEHTYPIYFHGETIAWGARAEDPNDGAVSGIRTVSVTLDPAGDSKVLASRQPALAGRPEAGPALVKNIACEAAVVCGDAELLLSALALGSHSIQMDAVDTAGNAGTLTVYLSKMDLSGAIEWALTEVQALIDNPATPAMALANLEQALTYLDRAGISAGYGLLGGAILSLEDGIKRLSMARLNGADVGDIPSLLLRAAQAEVELLYREAVTNLGVGHVDVVKARELLDGATIKRGNADFSGAILDLANAYFALNNGLHPWPTHECQILDRLTSEAQGYVDIGDDVPGLAEIQAALLDLEVLKAQCPNLAELRDDEVLFFLFDLQDVAVELQTGDDQGVWVRNWQWGLVQAVRITTGRSLDVMTACLGEDDPDIIAGWAVYDAGLALIAERRVDEALDLYVNTRCLMVTIYNKDRTCNDPPTVPVPPECQ